MNQLVVTDIPFVKGRELVAPEGMTLLEITQSIPLPAYFDEDGVICIGEREIPRDLWPIARAKIGFPIRIYTRVRGGKFGGVLMLVAAIAVAAAAAFVSGGALVPFLTGAFGSSVGGLFAAGHIGAVLGAGLVSVLGSLAIGALTPKGGQQTNTADSGQSSNASLSGNIIAPDGRLPRSVGRNILFPPFVTQPLTESIGDDQYIEGVVALGGPHNWLEFRSSNSNIAQMTDINVESRPGLPGDTPLTLVKRYAVQSTSAIQISKLLFDPQNGGNLASQSDPSSVAPQWHRVTTKPTPDEFWLTFAFTEGLWDDANTGNDLDQHFRIRIRRRGASAWINLPELRLVTHVNRMFRKMVKLKWQVAPTIAAAPTSNGFLTAYWSVPVATATTVVTTGGWLSPTYFQNSATITDTKNVALFNDHAEIYLDPATFPKDTYEIEVMASTVFPTASFTASVYQQPFVGVVDLFGFNKSGSTYVFYGFVYTTLHRNIIIEYYASVRNQSPITQMGTDACAAIVVKNRNIDQFSAIVEGLTYDYNGTDWSTLTGDANPALHFRDLHANPNLSAYTFEAASIDDDSILAWRDYCSDQSLECNAVIENQSWADARAFMIAAGQGIIKGFDKIGVAFEHDRTLESPIFPITPVNSNNDRWQVPFDRRPDALVVNFRNEDEDYVNSQMIVYDDGKDATNAVFYDSVTYDYITAAQQASDQAKWDMRRARLRSTIHTRTVAAEGIILEAGDLIAVQDDVLSRLGGHTRIKAALTSGPNITGVQLYSKIPVWNEPEVFSETNIFNMTDIFEAGIQTGVAIRSKADVILTKAVTEATGLQDTLTFQTPFTPPTGGILSGDMLWSGPIGTEHKRMVVLAIAPPNENGECNVTMVDEAPTILAATPVIPPTVIALPGAMVPQYAGLVASKTIAQFQANSALVDVNFNPLAAPVNAVAGDFVMVFAAIEPQYNNSFGAVPSTNPPTGWNRLDSNLGGNLTYLRVYYRKITGAESAVNIIHQAGVYGVAAIRISNCGVISTSPVSGGETQGNFTQPISVSAIAAPVLSWFMAQYGFGTPTSSNMQIRTNGIDDHTYDIDLGDAGRVVLKWEPLSTLDHTAQGSGTSTHRYDGYDGFVAFS